MTITLISLFYNSNNENVFQKFLIPPGFIIYSNQVRDKRDCHDYNSLY